jgi:L-arabinokinase
MGYRILAEAFGFRVEPAGPGRVRIEDDRYGGYLANLSPTELDDGLIDCLPIRISGAEFLRRYGGTTDATTSVDPEQTYAVRTATEHPVREHHRVRRFAGLLRRANTEQGFSELGDLMLESHASYTACGLGSDGTDQLVRLVQELGAGAGLFGAKITGGGSGGTVAVLASVHAESAVRALAERYSRESGRATGLFIGSSAGAAEFGTLAISGDRLVK